MAPIVILSDGTWCGREAGTKTNIYRLAKYIGIDVDTPDSLEEYVLSVPGKIHARYRHGVGLGSTFLDYLFNGVTAQDLAAECIMGYKFIVDHYSEDDEVWLFGLSRGAYTVRCIAGMINNCGIVRKSGRPDEDVSLLCEEVYRIYRSRDAVNAPHSLQSEEFRRRNSHPLIGDGDVPRDPPVRFMGILDTVGELGIPTFTGGVGLDWPEFYDGVVSSVVGRVCHLVSLHDRFYIFQPCLARRGDGCITGGIHEEWIPGVHYDLGRQRFRFFRVGAGIFESTLAHWAWATKPIEPNAVLADFTLLRMLEHVQEVDSAGAVVPAANMQNALGDLRRAIAADAPTTGDGDVYERVLRHAPFGELLNGAAALGMKIAPGIWQLFLALRDRFIPSIDAAVYDLQQRDPDTLAAESLAAIARVSPDRYPSRTLRAWGLRGGTAHLRGLPRAGSICCEEALTTVPEVGVLLDDTVM